MTIESTQSVPLSLWKDGSIRIKGSRLLLDIIINAHNRGERPEMIYESFPSNSYTVADIYSVIAYYLSNKKKLDRYLEKRQQESEELWKKIEADPDQRRNKRQLGKRIVAFRKEQGT